ncbi:anaerobic ribonucleoside-triphosphate reductase activating protein [Anaerobacterium chartisolvens]|uniref:Anaerobic ribonucleoside-triphosphate reductase-activating protein n=1 Tax=Anaerobacterium chartisolvens TaxID=1297424 RepID=A0A369BA80_9FIRM|nr:anaerobic ribonucleoside-triphosphate reductase activating protein [Anaerobacterium chartisolvens]RCX18433.1 anaerobic ribonucleoside-triphosphate reductase activating protein [Anaerobacterium chartisolvens]
MSAILRVAGIVKESIVDGPGIRFVVFAQGCPHRCPGCHNPHTHSFEGGAVIEVDDIVELAAKNPMLKGITFSGGEPFEQGQGFAELAYKVGRLGMDVMTYTGYTYEEITTGCEKRPEWGMLIDRTDILVDGRFELDRKNPLLAFKGSENQRIIDVKKSRALGRVVEVEL